MKAVSRSAFRANCEVIFDWVYKTKHPVAVKKFGKPLVEIHPPAVTKSDKRCLSVWNKARAK